MSQLHGKNVDAAGAATYRESGWWSDVTVTEAVADHAAVSPDAPAYLTETGAISWSEVEQASSHLAGCLVAAGVEHGDRVAVWLGETPTLHIAFLAVEKAGATIVGIGSRSGRREVAQLLDRTGARLLVTDPAHEAASTQGRLTRGGPAEAAIVHMVLDGPPAFLSVVLDGRPSEADSLTAEQCAERRLGPDELYLINSTSGTTGLPKSVMHYRTGGSTSTSKLWRTVASLATTSFSQRYRLRSGSAFGPHT